MTIINPLSACRRLHTSSMTRWVRWKVHLDERHLRRSRSSIFTGQLPDTQRYVNYRHVQQAPSQSLREGAPTSKSEHLGSPWKSVPLKSPIIVRLRECLHGNIV